MDNDCRKILRTVCCYCFVSLIVLLFIVFFKFVTFFINPTNVNCRVTNALLTQSNFTLEITIRNPNMFFQVHHDDIDITVNYKNQALGSINYSSFSQGVGYHETHLTPTFQGLILGGGESNDSVTNIVVKLYMQDEYKRTLRPRKRVQRKLEHTCNLKVPLSSNEQSGNGKSFHTTRCISIFFEA